MRSLWQRRSLLTGYWHYWLNAVNQHSLHAPFIYQFYQQVILSTQSHPSFGEIEQYRQRLLQSEVEVLVEPMGAASAVSKSDIRTVKSIARHSLSTPKFGRFLYNLIQFQQPKHIVELGTSLGTSTLYLALANSQTTVYTLEGSTSIAKMANQAFQDFHCQNIELQEGNIDHVLPKLLKEIPQVDIAYVDANHRLEPTLRYFSQLLAKTNEESILVFDDIHWSFGMRKAWKTMIQHPKVTLSVDLFDAGLIFFRPLTYKQHYHLYF